MWGRWWGRGWVLWSRQEMCEAAKRSANIRPRWWWYNTMWNKEPAIRLNSIHTPMVPNLGRWRKAGGETVRVIHITYYVTSWSVILSEYKAHKYTYMYIFRYLSCVFNDRRGASKTPRKERYIDQDWKQKWKDRYNIRVYIL